MISQTNSAAVRTAYASNFGETKDVKSSSSVTKGEQGSKTSKVDQFRAAINSGNYKVDIDQLSSKMADDLLF